MNFVVGLLLFAMTTFFPMVVVLEENALEDNTCFLCFKRGVETLAFQGV
jgi:hypothetical protein